MPWQILDIPMWLPVFALVLFRLTGLVAGAPLLSSTVIPIRIRAALVLALAGLTFPLVRSQAPADLGLAILLPALVGEFLIGLTVGLGVTILLTGAEVAGTMVGQQAGIALGEIVNPAFEEPVTVVSQLYSIVLMLVFLIAGGLRALVAAVLDTYQVIPLLKFSMNESYLILLVELLASAMVMGIRLAGPVLIALFVTEAALGFLARTMPQLNVMSVGFTLRVLLAVGMAGVSLALSQELMIGAVQDGMEMIRAGMGLSPAAHRLVI